MLVEKDQLRSKIDLAGTNGSWLNDKRLTPNKPYSLANGSQLRFGQMQLLFLY
jgi:pSer/pThr/pTyr-binding forkhead associated (FHA) protein